MFHRSFDLGAKYLPPLPGEASKPARFGRRQPSSCMKQPILPYLLCLVLGSGVLFGRSVAAAAEDSTHQLAIPPQDAILRDLKPGHPRLLASAKDFERLREEVKSTPYLKAWYQKLEGEAQDILKAAPSKYEIPDGLRLLSTSRRVLRRVETLALLYQIQSNQQYLERMWQELEAAANFTNWNPRHFLDTAEMTRAFATGYDWLYHAWSPKQREVLRQAMVKHGLKPALEVYRGKKGWARARHNWNQVCNGGIGMGALALGDVEPELASEVLHSAVKSLPLAMAEFAPDGAWNEGPGYWSYATAYNVAFLDALTTALGTDFGLASIPGFSETGYFPLYIAGPLERTFNYADGGDRAIRAPQIFWLAERFKTPVLAWYERQTMSPAPLDLLWSSDAGLSPKAAGFPLDKYFRVAEVVTMRSAWEERDAWFVGFKAGDNKANHSHLDLGSFVLDALGVRWATDLGADDYNLPGYFGRQRWSYYRIRAEGQNTLVINPTAETDQDPAAATKVVRFESKPDRVVAVADLTPAYRAHDAERVWRGIAMLDRNRVLIQDEVRTSAPAQVWWFMHTGARIELAADGKQAVLSDSGKRLYATILAPAGGRFEVMAAAPLPTSPAPAKQGSNQKVRKLAVHLLDASDVSLSILFSEKAEGTGTLGPLEKW